METLPVCGFLCLNQPANRTLSGGSELIFSRSQNNTFVRSVRYWETGQSLISEDDYGVGVGGLFVENSSSTWSEKLSMFDAGASEESSTQYANDTWGTDLLHINSSYSLDSFPIDITGDGDKIGIGTNSTLLNTLKSSSAIASRTWSFFWGLKGFETSAQMDGVAVFGGYDQAKISGPNMTVPLTSGTNCATDLVVTVASVEMQFPDGQIINLQNASSPLKYCLDPSFTLLSLHPDMITTFTANSGGDYLGISNALYENQWALRYLTSGV